MGGWPEEVFYSMYRIAIIKGITEKPNEEIIRAFEECYNYKPDRAEPLYQISRIYRGLGKNALAFMFAKTGLEIPYPQQDILFIQEEIYKYALLDEIGATAFYAGKPHMGYAACKRLLEENLIPDEHRPRVKENYESYTNVMNQMQQQQMKVEMDNQIADLKRKQRKQANKQPVKKL